MLELKAIQRKRKLFYRVILYSLIASPLTYMLMHFIKDIVDFAFIVNAIEKVSLVTFMISVGCFGFNTWFPVFKEFNERGTIIFDYQGITRSVFNKESKFSIYELSELKFDINGHWGQDKSRFPHIIIANGASNFVTLKTKDFKVEKIEFYLDSKQTFNSLKKYIKYYSSQTKVKTNTYA